MLARTPRPARTGHGMGAGDPPRPHPKTRGTGWFLLRKDSIPLGCSRGDPSLGAAASLPPAPTVTKVSLHPCSVTKVSLHPCHLHPKSSLATPLCCQHHQATVGCWSPFLEDGKPREGAQRIHLAVSWSCCPSAILVTAPRCHQPCPRRATAKLRFHRGNSESHSQPTLFL